MRPTFRTPLSVLLCLTLFVTTVAGGAVAAAEASPLDIFDACWETVRTRFYDSQLHNVDWFDVRQRYRPRAARTEPGRPMRNLLREMVAELQASHMTILHPEVYRSLSHELQNRRTWTHGVVIEETESDRFFVRALYEDGPGERAGLEVGDRIVLVNGESPDRSDGVLDAGYDPALPGPRLFFLGAADGRRHRLVVQPDRDPVTRYETVIRPSVMNAVDAALNSVSVARREGLRIGYVHIWYCSRGVTAVVERALTRSLRGCDAVVVDLRGRGGLPQVVNQLLALFKGSGDRPAAWTRPAVFLIDERSRSAKEVIAYVVRDDAIGPLVGARTEGAVLGAHFFPLPDGSYVEVPVSKVSVRGEYLEGIGVPADVEVEWSLPFSGGVDPIRERGFEVAVRKVLRRGGSARLASPGAFGDRTANRESAATARSPVASR